MGKNGGSVVGVNDACADRSQECGDDIDEQVLSFQQIARIQINC
jgi:hypothetical protein